MPSIAERLQALEYDQRLLLERIHAAPPLTDILKQQTDHQSISDTQNAYNAIVKEISCLKAPVPCELISFLPTELFIDCVKLALPLPERGYTTCLLRFTLVSKRWRQILLSAPMLWAIISFNNYDGDSLATMATSLYLSRDTMVSLTVCPPLGEEWNEASKIITPHIHRIQHITVVNSPFSDHFINYSSLFEGYLYILETVKIFESLGHPPHIDSFDLGTPYALPMHMPDYTIQELPPLPSSGLNLPQNIRYMRHWTLQLDSFRHINTSLSCLRELHTEQFIDVFAPMLYSFPQLEVLSFTDRDSVFAYGGIPQPNDWHIRQRAYELKSLRAFHYSQPFSHRIPALIRQVATSLVSLSLRVPYRVVNFLIGVLGNMHRLQQLSLTMGMQKWDMDDTFVQRDNFSITVPTLWSLSLATHSEYTPSNANDTYILTSNEHTPSDANETYIFCRQTCGKLISALKALYPHVTTAHIERNGVIKWELVAPFLGNMQSLQKLQLTGKDLHVDEVSATLSALEELSIDEDDILTSINAPKLLHLTHNGSSFDRVQQFCHRLPLLRKLTSTVCVVSNHSVQELIHPENLESFIYVRTLHLRLQEQDDIDISSAIYLVSFPSLVKIVLSGFSYVSSQATFLCLCLLYQPELCPRLQELEFEGFPEWDCLFLMLEARNFHRNCLLSHISELTIPFVPHHLRSSLSCLLRGEFTTRPSNCDLSIYATRETLFDASMYVVRGF
ncbi:hypothetical protein M408DRAFT_27781 [Serendipita vermifera MAFF 305830]|uniref:C2H2-type domain-containing protein n=1 Tax=Serendipita vermifera MAFF 305830 TaxID=933852 RepID=A0A0C3AFY6_SERVB|nr:hypothetical protein M408DRAFT_27781 [Serendipita vermifera MAFF 305830]